MINSLQLKFLTILFLLHLVVAYGQHHHRGDRKSPREAPLVDTAGIDDGSSRALKRGEARVETTGARFRDTDTDPLLSSTATAIATRASSVPVARAKPSQGITSPLSARSLEDWEVEDFILATVDGTVHATDRKTGAERWSFGADKPMVETIYHHVNKSTDQPTPEDDMIWIVEPTQDGNLYVYHNGPNAGLQKLPLTVRQLASISPYSMSRKDGAELVYNAERRTTLFSVDARTGKVMKAFGSGGSVITNDTICPNINGLEIADEECGSDGLLTLGRTEYTVGIQKSTGETICTIKYWEWGPNVRDRDLAMQYVSTLDKKYIYSGHDGQIFSFDHARVDNENRKLFAKKFASPVVRVFDVVRPVDATPPDELIILAQPVAPVESDPNSAFRDRELKTFVNCTESGGWYAMSENVYPLVTGEAPQAQCYDTQVDEEMSTFIGSNFAQRKHALVGVHQLMREKNNNHVQIPTISGPKDEEPQNDTPEEVSHPSIFPAAPALGNSRLIGFAVDNIVDIGIIIPLVTFLIFIYSNKRNLGKLLAKKLDVGRLPGVKAALMTPPPTPGLVPKENETAVPQQPMGVNPNIENPFLKKDDPSTPRLDPISSDSNDANADGGRLGDLSSNDLEAPRSPPEKEKKKAHRGQRGGAKRRKGKKDADKEKEEKEGVDRIVEEVKEIGMEPALEPDVKTITVNGVLENAVSDISGPFQINNLVVTDDVLGYGSHGTIVYRGNFEGREVAVKRMLLEFFDVASHEVALLQESDDHPNVIRYFCKQQSAGFLYIALELCPASLQDVIEKPWLHESLVNLMDPPNVLYQIAMGVRYLHSLKIVHRDLKPQNILVAPPKIPKGSPDIVLPPRLLISDFGLCKKLEGDQSSFRATTAHAAGTSGWRAPELLVDDDASPVAPPGSESIQSHGSTSEPAIIDTLSNRRATRAIDIFSLGCVFYYILSGGNHPFGDRYMREGNIVKGNFNLDHLQALGGTGNEARDLISRMLSHNPRERPDSTSILIHPFFWSPEKRLNFLVDLSDHFEFEQRDPPSVHLQMLEDGAPAILGSDFLKRLDRSFVDTLGKQRKYTGSRMLDLLRALRNKKNHYQDMPDNVKAYVGPLPEGYLNYWTSRFPLLLLHGYYVVIACELQANPRFKAYLAPPV